jgi:hypothetical protein
MLFLTVVSPFLERLAKISGRPLNDLSDAYSTGDAVIHYNESGDPVAFVCADILPSCDKERSNFCMLRVIDFLWTDPSLSKEETKRLSRQIVQELLRRFWSLTVILTEPIATLVWGERSRYLIQVQHA